MHTPPETSHTDTQVGRSAQFLGSKMKQTSHTPIDDQRIPPKNTQIKFPAQSTTPNGTNPVKNWRAIKVTPRPSDEPASQSPASPTATQPVHTQNTLLRPDKLG